MIDTLSIVSLLDGKHFSIYLSRLINLAINDMIKVIALKPNDMYRLIFYN